MRVACVHACSRWAREPLSVTPAKPRLAVVPAAACPRSFVQVALALYHVHNRNILVSAHAAHTLDAAAFGGVCAFVRLCTAVVLRCTSVAGVQLGPTRRPALTPAQHRDIKSNNIFLTAGGAGRGGAGAAWRQRAGGCDLPRPRT